LGIAFHELGEPLFAISSFNIALEQDPRFAKAYLNRGLAWEALNELEMALLDADQCLLLEPESQEGLAFRGRLTNSLLI